MTDTAENLGKIAAADPVIAPVLDARTAPVAALPPATDRFEPPVGLPQRYDRRSLLHVSAPDGEQVHQAFLLQGWQRASQEQMQVVLNTEGWQPFFYKSKPILWTFTGSVFDAPAPWDWTHTLIDFYETYMRGSIAAGQFEASVLTASRQVRGYAIGLNLSNQAPFDAVVQFTLRLIATSDHPLVVQQIETPPADEGAQTPPALGLERTT